MTQMMGFFTLDSAGGMGQVGSMNSMNSMSSMSKPAPRASVSAPKSKASGQGGLSVKSSSDEWEEF